MRSVYYYFSPFYKQRLSNLPMVTQLVKCWNSRASHRAMPLTITCISMKDGWKLRLSVPKWEKRSFRKEYIQKLSIWRMISFKDFYLFILREIGKESKEGTEAEWERISGRHPTEYGACVRAQSHNPEIMSWVEIKSQLFNWLSHPGAPGNWFLLKYKSLCIIWNVFRYHSERMLLNL